VISPDNAPDRSPGASDPALVQRVADGDPLALSALYDRHAQGIYSHALHLLGDVAEAEDAVEETFWRAWRRAGDYDPSGPEVATWLLLICRQRATEQLGAKKRSQSHVLNDPTGLDPADAAGSAIEAEGERARIAAALAAIPVDQRTVLELAFFRGIAPANVASLTKQSPETARTRLRVAMRKLRDAVVETVEPPVRGSAEGTQ